MKYFLLLFLAVFCTKLPAQSIVSDKPNASNYPLITATQIPAIYVDAQEDWLVQKAAALLQQDMEKVTGNKPLLIHQLDKPYKNIIAVGTVAKSVLLKELVKKKLLNTNVVKGKWEAYQLKAIVPGFSQVEHIFTITGSDKRGAAYGVLELARQIGVSPWYWWADVPVQKKNAIYISKNSFIVDSPKVKYRGIFLNDEAPALTGWANEKFGGLNHGFYEKVFELLLRLKANYLWPAMWGNAFNDDDTLNPVMADRWGIVMGTSHHEPMVRSQQEWKRYGKGEWNYTTNDTVLRRFWQKGIENMGSHESIVTIGMRGDGDAPMTQGTATSLLERIVADQRKIITDVTGKPAWQTPQLWALYKEVQDYYDKGMRVPDDVTLLLCDDNWGNLRKLPGYDEKPRGGGYGIYYHFDYVGGPRNYKWINTNNISRVWEQMNLAYDYHARRIWIVNVGDLKPMELPISFFLDQAWNPERFNAGNIATYTKRWAAGQFGNTYAKEIGYILDKYTQFNARRKPELLSPDTYKGNDYFEYEQVVNAYDTLRKKAENISLQLTPEYKDAYYELVLHQVQASANLNELYYTIARNRIYAKERLAEANTLADKAKALYAKDSAITQYYNDTLAGGKWHHMMDQTHIGYTYWQQPPFNKMPEVNYVAKDSLIEPQDQFDTTSYTAEFLIPANAKGKLFYESDKYVSIRAAHFTKAIPAATIHWQVIPGIGREDDGMTAFPTTVPAQKLTAASPHLEYEIYTYDTGTVKLQLYFSPTLPFNNTGLQYAVSIDNQAPQVINLHQDYNSRNWNQWVADNIIIQTTQHRIEKAGKHTVKYWLIDPAIVLQKLVLDFGGVKPSYLGPQETLYHP